jgi:hypothetical protein
MFYFQICFILLLCDHVFITTSSLEYFNAMNKTLSISLSMTSSSSDEELSSLVQRIFLKKIVLVLFPLYICLLLDSSYSFIFFFLWGHLL